MIDFGALPPELNSARMYAGPGPLSLTAAATAWDGLASELHFASSNYRTVIAGLTTARWTGPTSLAVASAFAPYMAWTAGAAARAEEAASQARLAVEVYEAAFAMTVPPPAVIANRVQLATLIATNFFGQNSAAIAATEAEYGEMWAQDAAAMYQYAANSAAACDVTPFVSPPEVANPNGVAAQTTAVANAAAAAGTQNAANVVASVPTTLQTLAAPLASFASSTFSGSSASSMVSNIVSNMPGTLPSYLMASATPLYGMSSILAMAQTGQGLASSAAQGAAAAASGAAAGAANAASAGAGALGSTVFGSLGTATSLGPLSVPASWTSVIPTANMSAASALPNVVGGTNMPPSMLGSLPRLASAGKTLGPRYGVVPTVMTRPPSGGYT